MTTDPPPEPSSSAQTKRPRWRANGSRVVEDWARRPYSDPNPFDTDYLAPAEGWRRVVEHNWDGVRWTETRWRFDTPTCRPPVESQ